MTMTDRQDLEDILNRVADRIVAALRPEGKDSEPKTDTPDFGPGIPEKSKAMMDRGVVLLPKEFKTNEKEFEGWVWEGRGSSLSLIWVYRPSLSGQEHFISRCAVPADSEIARLNNLGFGPLPEGEEWHNPDNLSPATVEVGRNMGLLLKSEVRDRKEETDAIQVWTKDGWVPKAFGFDPFSTYRVDRNAHPFHWDRWNNPALSPHGLLWGPDRPDAQPDTSKDHLPPFTLTGEMLTRGAVLLPKEFVTGGECFEGWMFTKNNKWAYAKDFIGAMKSCRRFAVPADSLIARLNNVGFGPLPKGEEWHNPDGLTPAQVDVAAGMGLLLKSEVRERRPSSRIQLWISGDFFLSKAGFAGCVWGNTYRVNRITHPFHWDRPEKPDLGKHPMPKPTEHVHRDGDLWKANNIDRIVTLRAGGRWMLIYPDRVAIGVPQFNFPDTSPAWTHIGNIFAGVVSMERVRWALSAEDEDGGSIVGSDRVVLNSGIHETRHRLREIGVIES